MKETKCTWVGQITKSPTAARGLLCEVKTSRDVEPWAQPAGLLNLVSRTEGEPLGSGKVTRGEYFFFLQIFNSSHDPWNGNSHPEQVFVAGTPGRGADGRTHRTRIDRS